MTMTHSPTPSVSQLAEQFLQSLAMRNCSPQTVSVWRGNLARFLRWSEDRGATGLGDLSSELIAAYRRYLYHYRQRNGQPLKFSTQLSYLVAPRRFLHWLWREGWHEQDVTVGMELPKEERRLPMDSLTIEQVERVLNVADVSTPKGLRDRAIMETFYSSGIRCGELQGLQTYDLDAERGVLRVRQGKGAKDRVVPIGQRALSWLRKYTGDVRPQLLTADSQTFLFVSLQGRPFGRNALSAVVKDYLKRAGIKQRGSCHLLRHTAATLMMEGGADIRALQLFLGHEKLNTTQLYTHVSIQRLQDIHARTHPADAPRTDTDQSADEPDA